MSRIEIRHPHSLTQAQARKAVEEVARKLHERFQLACDWQGDTLHFSRSGVDGKIELLPGALQVHAKLGFLTAMFKEPIEAEIRRVLKERF
ncbi:MAG: polyhydroxyalkanoic acid system family protein [Thermomonas hydrothermalis]|uniref:polyhydroxyalkanoic acid system family protein n=1 Tax=Thermomonas hydrothermalis TaxID=213588 RepID=UPI002353F8B2|nr:polyhydroxyalkanoic acid system family protein [Thermomonas hydrothermalis]MCL6618286.1 polyhydroxyalkanoic acid system family protein [Thermomonas hydrothermalis]